VLILDDAMSAIDGETETLVLNALRERRGRATTLLIAHRLSDVAHADRVIVLDRGRIIQAGTHCRNCPPRKASTAGSGGPDEHGGRFPGAAEVGLIPCPPNSIRRTNSQDTLDTGLWRKIYRRALALKGYLAALIVSAVVVGCATRPSPWSRAG